MTESEADSPSSGECWRRRLRLVRKELRETLRDRRTVLTLLLMPILAYPLLGIAFQRLLLSQFSSQSQPEYHIGLASNEDWREFEPIFQQSQQAYAEREAARAGAPGISQAETEANAGQDARFQANIPEPGDPPLDVEHLVTEGAIDLGVVVESNPQFEKEPLSSGRVRLIYIAESARSLAAYRAIVERLEALNEKYLVDIAREYQHPSSVAEIVLTRLKLPEGENVMLASLVPLILLLMTVTGAVYPAIDLTAGERERHTLETLIATPVSRLELLFAKYLAVLCVAVLTAVINLTAMYLTMQAVGFEQALFGNAGLRPGAILALLGLLTVFAAFFSAVLLCLTSVARSFKEAQAYLIPLMLLSMAPGVVSLLPGVRLGLPMAFVPLLNIVLLSRAAVLGSVSVQLAVVVVASTLIYGALALSLAARWFGSDAVLAGSAGSWRELFQRPEGTIPRLQPAIVATTFLAMFLGYFLLGSLVSRMAELPIAARLTLNGVLTMVLSGVLPWAVAAWERVPPISALRLWRPPLWACLGALIAGLCAWPLVYEITLFQQQAGIASFDEKQVERVRDILQAWNDVPFAIVLISLAVVPAIFEELSFRGFLFAAIRPHLGGWRTVIATAVAFGAFHLVVGGTLAIERLLPSTLLGLLLGTIALWSGSVIPGMLFHVANNGLLLAIARFPEELKRRGLDVADEVHLPGKWLALAAVGVLLGMGLVLAVRQRAVETKDSRSGAI